MIAFAAAVACALVAIAAARTAYTQRAPELPCGIVLASFAGASAVFAWAAAA